MANKNRFDILDDDDDDNDPYHLTVCSYRYIIQEIAKENYRNWSDLNQDMLSLIFIKLGALDILYNAQFVCSSWRKLSKEPHLFRSIDLRRRWKFFHYNKIDLEKMARVAVDRSCGQLVEFSMDYFWGGFGEEKLLEYVINKSNSLKCLRVSKVSIEHLKKFPFLEELQLRSYSVTVEMIEEVGRSCSQLKYLLLDLDNWLEDFKYGWYLESVDTLVYAIGKSIPQLRCLYLCGTEDTYEIMQYMPNGFPSRPSFGLGSRGGHSSQPPFSGLCGRRSSSIHFCASFRGGRSSLRFGAGILGEHSSYMHFGDGLRGVGQYFQNGKLEKKFEEKIKCLMLPLAENYSPKYVRPKPVNRGGRYIPYDDYEVNTDLVFLPKKTATCYL